MQLEVISTSDGLVELRHDWESLERRDPHAPYYVTHRQVSGWWGAHADQPDLELHVARITNNGKLVGIAPLALRTRSANGRTTRVLRFAGQGDYLAPILDPDASAGAICKALQRHLESADDWDRVNLGNIPATSRWAHHLLKSSQNPAFTLHVECPYVDLSRYDDLAAFSAENVSSQLRNYRNKFHREVEPAFRVWRGNEGDILSRIVDLHRREKEFLIQQKDRTERYSLFEDPARLAHIRSLFTGTDDTVTFGYESREGELIGYITCFDYRRTMLSWNVAYHPDYEKHRIGRVLHYETLAHLFETGEADRFDFGAGRYPWKFEWTGDFAATYRLQLDLKPGPEGKSADSGPADSQLQEGPKPPMHQAAPQEPVAADESSLRKAARRLGLGKARRLGREAVARLRPPVIWYIPHPDDETIFMGGSISMNRGRRNILVVLTRGGASGAFTLVNDRLKKPLDLDGFMAARARELTAAAEVLGVPARDIIRLDLPDGGVEVDDVHRVVGDMARRFPRASHRTLSYLDAHRDHANAGEALRKAYESRVVKDCVFHLPVPLVDEELGSVVRLDERAVAAKRAALGEYEVWRPRQGRYAIGAHSVKKLLKQQSEAPTERVHGPDYQS